MCIVKLLDCVVKALEEAGYPPPSGIVDLEGVKERRLPMGRIERQSRFKARFYPRPTEEVLSFHPEKEGRTDYPLSELARCLELIATPDGLLRGNGIECAVKDGAAVVKVSYTEHLRETPPKKPEMGRMTLTFEVDTQ